MPLYQRPVSPFFLRADSLALATSGTGPAFPGQVILNGIELIAPVTVTQMRTVFSGAPTGTCQMGIYDSSAAGQLPGSLMGNTATFTAVNGVMTRNLLSNLPLGPGKYWLAFLDTVADTVFGVGGGPTGFYATVLTTTTGLTTLPGTAGAVTDNNVATAFCALVLGGWS